MRNRPAPDLTATALCLCGACLALVGFSFVTVEHLKRAFLGDRAAASPGRLLGALGVADWGPVVIGVACGIAVIVLEWRRQGLRRLLGGESPGLLYLALAALLLWFAHALLAPGLIVTGDGGTHVARVSHLAMALADGGSLYWDNFFFGGGTLLQFTGPVFHWFAALVTLAVGDPTAGIKITAVAFRFLAALFMLLFLRRAGLGRTAAFFGALFFGGSFYMTYLLLIRSTFPQVINLAAISAMLYCIEGILRRPRLVSASSVGLCLAAIAMIGDHPPTALMAAALLALYLLLRLGLDDWRLAAVPPLLLAAAVTAIGGIYFLLPFAWEKSWTAEDTLRQALIGVGWPDLSDIANYFVWGRMGRGASSTAYLGLSIVLAALAGGAVLWRRPALRGLPAARLWWVFAVMAAVSFFPVGFYVRQTVFIFAFLCVAAAAAVQLLLAAFPARAWLPVLLLGVFLLDAGPAALQPFTRSDMLLIETAGRALAEKAGGERVLQLTPADDFLVSAGPNSTPLHYARVQMLHGPHKPDATKAHNGIVAGLSLVQDDLLATHRLGAFSRLLLGMQNVGWVVAVDGPRMGMPAAFPETLADPVLGAHWRLAEATPVLASGRFEVVSRPASFDGLPLWNEDMADPQGRDARTNVAALVRRMGISLAARQADAFLLTAPPGEGWPAAGPAPRIELAAYRVEPGRVLLAVQADRAGLLRLAHPMYPAVTVLRDGRPVAAVGDVLSFIVLPIEAGRNEIEVIATPSRLRLVCFVVTAATIFCLLAGLVALMVRERNAPVGS